jgi:hypothetical protein
MTATMKRGWLMITVSGRPVSTTAPASNRLDGWRRIEKAHHDQACCEEQGSGEECAGKGHRGQQVARPQYKLRPDDGGCDTADKHDGYRLGAECRRAPVGRRESELLCKAVGRTGKQQTECEEPKGIKDQRASRDEETCYADHRAGHEAEPPSDPAHDHRGRKRSQRHADIEAGDRRSGERLVGIEEVGAGKAAERDADRR